MDRIGELIHFFRGCCPGVFFAEDRARMVLEQPQVQMIERRDQDRLTAVAVWRENVILMFCVDPEYRSSGIGSEILTEAEEKIRLGGFPLIKLFWEEISLTPGAPMCPETRAFWEKRGYYQKDGTEYADLKLELKDWEDIPDEIGDTIDGITYRYAIPMEREGAVNCAGEAGSRFVEAFWNEEFYKKKSRVKVLVAVPERALDGDYDPASDICGALLVDFVSRPNGQGSIACPTVNPAWAGQGIAANMVRIATQELKNQGLKEVVVSAIFQDIMPMYRNFGYQIGMQYFRGEKILEPLESRTAGDTPEEAQVQEEKEQKGPVKEIYIQYRELEGRMDSIEERICEQFCSLGNAREDIKKLQIYVKPEDFTAYYMINDTISGKVGIF
ncbi:MAG: GNAT family N-acetyltransferase [Lachnospiraceae bacterium]|nr:GNAT family N-acetyltransferase [Lachnospiraceae bacterium]